MGIQIELSGKINKCREFIRGGGKVFVLNITHCDDSGNETVLNVNSDKAVGASSNIIDMVIEMSSYKKADAFTDQNGKSVPYLKDVTAFKLVG